MRLLVSIIPLLLFISLLNGCDMRSKGYQHGFKGKSKPILYSLSQNYHKGYNEGRFDAEKFDYGYYDAKHSLPPDPNEKDNSAYLKGYNEGRGNAINNDRGGTE